MSTPGWVYILVSQSHPGIVKIGMTTHHTPGRMLALERGSYRAFAPWVEVLSRPVADCARVETAAHRMLANKRVRLDRLPCRELFRCAPDEACRVVEAAALSLTVRRPRALARQPQRRFRPLRWRRPLMMVAAVPLAVWLIGMLLR